MKVSFPLSLKFSLWLLLNLLLLGGLAVGFLAAEGGLGWDSLVRGPAGNRAQELGNVIVGEFTAATATADARRGVLERFGATYGATFYLCHPSLPGAAQPRDVLPAAVYARVEEGRMAGPAPGLAPAPRPGPGPAHDDDLRPPGLDDPGPPPPRDGPPDAAERQRENVRGRFLVLAAA